MGSSFKNGFGCVYCSCLYRIWYVVTFGLQWNAAYNFIYLVMIAEMIIVLVTAIISSFVLVSRAYKAGTMMSIPLLLHCIFVESQV